MTSNATPHSLFVKAFLRYRKEKDMLYFWNTLWVYALLVKVYTYHAVYSQTSTFF